MGELEVLREVERVRRGDVSVDLKEVHVVGLAGEPETTEHLGNDVKGHLDVGDSLDDAAGNTEDHGD